MSTIDLTKVAGFKAVDAEGNDMGIVSLSEMTNKVKESIIQEAVAMQSVSTLAETSTLAATDTYEDRLPTSDTFSHVRTLDANGNPRRTSSQAFATVVGRLIKGNFATKEEYKSVSLSKGESTYIDFLRFGTGNFLLSIRATSSNTEYLSLYDIFYVSIYASSSKNITSFNYMNNIEIEVSKNVESVNVVKGFNITYVSGNNDAVNLYYSIIRLL